jgi:hypothetical protein
MSDQIKRPHVDGDAGALMATGPVLPRWLGISGKAVYDLAKAGILVRVNREQFSLEESVPAIANISGRPYRNMAAMMAVMPCELNASGTSDLAQGWWARRRLHAPHR